MSTTADELVIVAQVFGGGATSLDSFISAWNSSSGIELAVISTQIFTLVPFGPVSILTNGAALVTLGIKIEENSGVASLGDVLGLAGNATGIAGALALGLGLPFLASALTVTGVALAVGGVVTTLYEKTNNLQLTVDSNGNFRAAVGWTPPRDPLALDLDGDGIETVGIGSNPVLFDHDANGIRTGTGWLAGDDAWLVRDLDGNGSIDSGRELFGVDTLITRADGSVGTASTGFEALATLDGNHDGVFDASDAAFGELRLWQDLNQDGISQAGELSTLAERGIASIGVVSNGVTTNLGNGNSINGSAVVTRTNGSTTEIDAITIEPGGAGNLDLSENPFFREFTDEVPLTEQALGLPELGGSGWVRDLREAVSLGSAAGASLAGVVDAYAQADTRGAQLGQVDGLLAAWAASSGRLSSSDAYAAWVRPIASTTISETSSSRTVRYSIIDPSDVESLDPSTHTVQTVHFGFASAVFYEDAVTESGHTIRVLNEAGQRVIDQLAILEVFNGERFFDLTQTLSNGGSGAGSGGGGGGGGTASLSGYRQVATVRLSNAQVALIQSAYAALSDSVYEGLVLQTRLRPYLDNIEVVIDEAGVQFDTTGLAQALDDLHTVDSARALTDLADLAKYARPTLDAVGFPALTTLRDWAYALPAGSADLTVLADLDVFLSSSAIGSDRSDVFIGNAASNTFSASDGNDVLDGGAGNDTLRGGTGDDLLDGGDDNDVLQGDAGSDTLLGGAGADTLYGRAAGSTTANYGVGNSDSYDGGAGNDLLRDYETSDGDVYRLNLGGDVDTVTDNGGAGDRIEIGAGVSAEQVAVRNDGSNLVVSISASDRIVVSGAYDSTGAATNLAIEEIRLADGTVWDAAAIRARALVTTEGADTVYGFSTDEVIEAGAGNDVVDSRGGNDVVVGGAGNDTLRGGTGDDLLDGGEDNDVVQGDAGSDTLLGGAGADTLYGRASSSTTTNYGAGNSDTYDGGAGNDLLYDHEGSNGDVYRLRLGGDADTVRDNGGAGDRIEIGAGVSAEQVVVRNDGSNLVVSISASDRIVVSAAYDSNGAATNHAIEEIRLADGTVWDAAAIRARALVTTEGADTVYGFSSADAIQGAGGNDVLYGRGGDDVLDGGEGNDVVHGEAGNDTLLGGAGNDTLYGRAAGSTTTNYGAGNSDTYDGGAGNDLLYDYEASAGDSYALRLGGGVDTVRDHGGAGDRIEIGAGVSAEQVWFRRAGSNLEVSLIGTGVPW